MNTVKKIGKLEAIAFLVIMMLNQIILNLPKSILQTSGSSSLLTTIYLSVIAILFCLLIIKLFSVFRSEDILDITEFLGGKILKVIIGICFLFLFVITSSIVLRYFSESLRLLYFQNAPIVFIALFFITGVMVCNKLGFKSVVLSNLVIVPIVAASLLIIFLSVTNQFELQRVYPIMGHGVTTTFVTSLSNLFAFGGFAFLYFLMPMLNKKEHFAKVGILALLISSIFLFISVGCLLLTNPITETSEELLPIYTISQSIGYGGTLQRMDALFIFIWMLSSFSYLSVVLMLMLTTFQKVAGTKNAPAMTYCFIALILGTALLPLNISDVLFLERTIYKYTTLILVFGISFFILLMAYFKKKWKKGVS